MPTKKFMEFMDTLDDDDHVELHLKQPLEKCCDLLDIVKCRNVDNPALCAEIRTSLGSSSDVERTFSNLKKLHEEDRNFLPTNLEYCIGIYCNLTV